MKINYSVKVLLLTLICLLVLTILLFLFKPLSKYSLWLYLIVITPILFIYGRVKQIGERFLSGLEGENDVDREAKSLGDDYIYIAGGFDTGKGNIDKIIIGPKGIWTLEVKSHKGEITFDGQSLLRNNQVLEKNFLSQAYAEAKTLQDFIKSKIVTDIYVQPVIVFSSKWAKVRLGLKKYEGVYVVQKAWLKKLITETYVQNLSYDIQTKIKMLLINNPHY